MAVPRISNLLALPVRLPSRCGVYHNAEREVARLRTAGAGAVSLLAEGAGFEPAIQFPAYTLSRRAPSAARPPLHVASSSRAARISFVALGTQAESAIPWTASPFLRSLIGRERRCKGTKCYGFWFAHWASCCWPAHLPPPWSMRRVRSRISSLRLRLWVWRWRRSFRPNSNYGRRSLRRGCRILSGIQSCYGSFPRLHLWT